MNDFETICQLIEQFHINKTIITENELEINLTNYLRQNNLKVTTQQRVNSTTRNDIVVKLNGKTMCIELKKTADLSCMKQLDKYLDFYNDGLILVCWKASENVRRVFQRVQSLYISIPTKLIELREYQTIV